MFCSFVHQISKMLLCGKNSWKGLELLVSFMFTEHGISRGLSLWRSFTTFKARPFYRKLWAKIILARIGGSLKAAAHRARCDAPRPLRSRLRQLLRLPMHTAAIFLRKNRATPAMRFQRQIALTMLTECDWSECGHRKWKEVRSTIPATK